LKLEVVCPDERCDEIVRLIGRAARTGDRGDGIITVLTSTRCSEFASSKLHLDGMPQS
jgi:nitrogen regulatory protein PII